MRFIYNAASGAESITLEGESFHHIFIVRREKREIGGILRFANLTDSNIYDYKITHIAKKSALLQRVKTTHITQDSPRTHIIQAIFDMGDFARILPTLNELFVEKITLFYGDFSQKNERVNTERLRKILINSCQQCGRLSLMEIEILGNLGEILARYPNAMALDLCDKRVDSLPKVPIIIGTEGGFSKKEREMLTGRRFGIAHSLILRAQSAALFVASRAIS